MREPTRRDDEAKPGEPPKQDLQANGLGVLFVAAALGLALVLSLVALVGYLTLSPSAGPANLRPDGPKAPTH